jgi:hypothetical protein
LICNHRGLVAAPFVDCPVLVEYFRRLDGPHPESVLALLAEDFCFTTLWGEEDVARPASGGVAELETYFASRDATGQRHHLVHGFSAGDGAELADGYTTRHGVRLASFVITLRLDRSGLIRRILTARTTAFSGGLLDGERPAIRQT